MPAQKSTASSLFTALLGMVGFSGLAGLLVTIMVAPAIAVTGVTASNTVGIFNSLPDYIELDSGSQQNNLVVVNPDGSTTQIATIYSQNREEVTLEEISDHLECAAIAGEDRRFYEHGGVDVPSLVRAVVGQVTGSSESGASTLSMQLVRNILQQQALNDPNLTQEQKKQAIEDALYYSLDRKIKEMKLAIGLEKNYTKDEILAGYLNIAGMGGNTYGVQAAAKEFFSTTAGEVTVAQAASIIAIVQNPTTRSLNSPENFERNQARRDVILGNMYTEGCITEAERDEALAIAVNQEFLLPSPPVVGCLNAIAPFNFACDYATRRVVIETLDALGTTPEDRWSAWQRGGHTLVLTINPELQNIATQTVQQWAPNNETRFNFGAASTSVEVGSGAILTMAQNKNYDNQPNPSDPLTTTAVNFNTDVAHGGAVGFQPGSTYKAYVLLAFLNAGHGLNESFDAGKLKLNQASFVDTCPPTDQGPPWGGQFEFKNDSNERGSYSVMRGTAASVNSVFVQMASKIDQCSIKTLAESIGVHNANGEALSSRPSCAIGVCENNLDPLTQAAAYAAIANGGIYCAPRIIADVLDGNGESRGGQPVDCRQSDVPPNVANTAVHALKGVLRGGTATASNPNDGTPYFGKTGTTDESIHTWMIGSSSRVATAVWVGNIVGEQALRNISINGTQAALLRHRIFRPIAQAIDARYPGTDWPAPDPALLTGTPVEVPNVVGFTLEQAKNAIELSELAFADGGEVDSERPAGQVARTDPGPGASVPRGTTVYVYRSNGLAEPVPNVVGMSEGDAKSALEAEGFSHESVCVDSDDVGNPTPPPANKQVMAQDPAAGTLRNPASTTVRISVYSVTPCS